MSAAARATDFRRGVAWSLMAAAFTGLFVIPWKFANEIGDPATSTLLLLASAAVLNTGLVLTQRAARPARSSRPLRTLDLWVALALAACALLGNLASAASIQRLSPSIMNTLMRGDVIVVALLAWMFVGERIEKRFWLGVAIALAGLVLVQGPQDGEVQKLDGTLFAFAALFCFSAMAVITRRFIHAIDPIAVNGLRLWVSLPLWFAMNGAPDALREIGVAYLGFCALAAFAGPFAGRLCLMISARYVDARISTLGMLSAPVVTLALEFAVLGEVPPPDELLGAAIMLAGIALPLLSASARRPAPVEEALRPRGTLPP